MDATLQLPDIATMLASYGAMGICLVYFIVKDWKFTQTTNDIQEKIVVSLEKVAASMDMCNRNLKA